MTDAAVAPTVCWGSSFNEEAGIAVLDAFKDSAVPSGPALVPEPILVALMMELYSCDVFKAVELDSILEAFNNCLSISFRTSG